MVQNRRNASPPIWAEVLRKDQVTPSLIRIALGGGELERFTPTSYTDQYINAYFPPAHAPIEVPFDRDEAMALPREDRPHPRRFTVRRWDAEAKELTVDFIVHGDEGYAGPWAKRAQPGDRLQFTGPGGGYAPDPEAAWHLMVGDESALPAIGASLEALRPTARCVVIAVVDGPEHELALDSPGSVEVRWLHRRGAADPETLLATEIEALEFPPGAVDVFVHGEAGEVRAVRRHLLADRGIPDSASISPYWRRRYTDETWREIKREWLAAQAEDVQPAPETAT